jgi:hypothetical protein
MTTGDPPGLSGRGGAILVTAPGEGPAFPESDG